MKTVHRKLFKLADSFLRLTFSRENARSHYGKEKMENEREREREEKNKRELAQEGWQMNEITLIEFKECERITMNNDDLLYFLPLHLTPNVYSFIRVIDFNEESPMCIKNTFDRD